MNFVDIYQQYWKNGYVLTDMNLSGIDREMFRTLFNPVAEVFRKYPAGDVHLYLPGTGNIQGLVTGNYKDSAGTTPVVVDQPVGLVLDAAGSVGADIKPTSGYWQPESGALATSLSPVSVAFNASPAADCYAAVFAGPAVGDVFKITFTVSELTSGSVSVNIGWGSAKQYVGANGTYSQNCVAAGNGALYIHCTAATSATVTISSVTKVTGIHASQSTPGYKPTMRRGIVNLLTYSNDLTNGAYQTQNGATKSGQTLNIASAGASAYHTTTVPVGTNTFAIVVSGSGTIKFWMWGATDGEKSPLIITLTDTPTLYAISATGAGLMYGFFGNAETTATSVTIGGYGLFAGTLTAAQILAAGGIPLTTTAPASSSAGNAYLEFDGVDDRLSLGGPLFQMADDHCVVAAAMKSSVDTTSPGIIAVEGTGTDLIGLTFSAAKVQYFLNAGGGVSYRVSNSGYQSIPIVVTGRKVGTSAVLRVNGVQQGAALSTSATGSGVMTSATIGRQSYAGVPAGLKGNIHCVLAIKGTVPDADLAVLEKFVAQLSGVTL